MSENETPIDATKSISLDFTSGEDSLTVTFSGFEKGVTVLKSIVMLTSPNTLNQLLQHFFDAGDLSPVEFVQQGQMNQAGM